MRRVAMVELIACWILWILPFALQRRKMRERKAEVTVKTSNWGIVLQGLGFFCAWIYIKSPQPPEALLVASMIIAPLSALFAWAAVRHLGKQWRIQAGLYSDHELVRTGPYRIVRHPIYASMLGMFLAAAFVMSYWPIWAVGLVSCLAGIEIRVRVEDGLLASRFGEQFAAYKAQVPAYLPFLR